MTISSHSSDPPDKGKSIMELAEDEDEVPCYSDSDHQSTQSSNEGLDGEDVEVGKRTNKKTKKTKPTLMWQVWEEETEKWLDQHMSADIDLDNMNEVITETVEPSPDIIVPLLRYQKEWLAWGLKQEESHSRGGILADEMGMGKTVQAIALVVTKRALCHKNGEPESSTGLPCVKGTLVICPLNAVTQWVNKIHQFTAKGSNKVRVYHGSNREKTLSEFSEYDFVITTYSIVENEWRKYLMPLKYNNTKCQKNKDSESPLYSGKFILHSMKWDRIILDEAHYIKVKSNNTARAVFALESSYKWALSGTALQNRVAELDSLVCFLRITPYSYYFCKDCDCKVLDYTPDEPCPDCPHRLSEHFCWWNKYVAKPIAKRGHRDEAKRAMILLKNKVFKSILLRRTKEGRASELACPLKIVTVRRDRLNTTEQEYYTSIVTKRYLQAGTVVNKSCHRFDQLIRQQKAANHPYLVVYSISAGAKSSDDQVCGLCDDVAEDPVVTSCEHVLCKSCLAEFRYSQPASPPCLKPVTVNFNAKSQQESQNPKMTLTGFKSTSIINRIPLEEFQTSTKIEALKEEIRFMVERDGSAKGIVFSRFASFLDLIKYSLYKSGVKCVELDGSMSMAEQEAVISSFTEDGECRILLMKAKAGGVALNLTVASHVFLMDPWQSRTTERTLDRIHENGQLKPIRVVKFVTEDTIEDEFESYLRDG